MSHIVTPHSTSDFFFRVADTVFHLSFSDRTDARALIPSYAPFYIETLGDSPLLFDFSVDTDLVTISPTSNPIGTFDCGGIGHTIYSIDEGYKILISGLNGKVACAMEAINGFTQCRATLFGEQSDQAFGLNNALMIAFTFAGAFHNILLIHSSVTIKDERAYLFLGKSGTGKSTHSSLWHQHIPGSELLNDDNPAIRITPPDPGAIVYGTPWSGKTPCYRNLSYPVGAVVRLEQYPENAIKHLPPIKAFANIFSSCSTMIWDKPSYEAILSTVNHFAMTAPSFHLRCRPDREAALLCYKTITSQYECTGESDPHAFDSQLRPYP